MTFQIEYPIDESVSTDEHFKRWKYRSYNFTLASFWTPHLVKGRESDPNGPTHTGLFSLYVDEPDEAWTANIAEFDYIVLSAGHWFYRPMVFHERGQVVGCHYCLLPNVTDLGMFFGYRRALRTALKAINEARGYRGVTYLRTFAPSHFENGLWNEGGNCLRKRPYRSNETALDGPNLEMYMTQLEEFRKAERAARRRGRSFRLLDTTQLSLLRPDGHPSRYGHWPHENVTLYNDCVHWCLPGPIDTWNDFLLEMIKTEPLRAADDRRLRSGTTL